MERDGTLHIKRSDLIKVLDSITYNGRTSGHKLAESIFNNAQPYQLTDRYLKILNQKTKTKKKLSRSMQADSVPHGTVERVNILIYDERKKKNKMGRIKPINKESSMYLQLKEVAKMAVDFADYFDIVPRSEGVEDFIREGIKMMGKYSLNRFKTYESSIYQRFEDILKVANDTDAERTREFYGAWQTKMLEYTNSEDLISIDKDLSKYVHMVYGREAADEVGVSDYEYWIESQFEGLSFLNVVPQLSQFYGDGAKKRYDSYSVASEDSNKNDLLDMY